jgi:hypothetical protein
MPVNAPPDRLQQPELKVGVAGWNEQYWLVFAVVAP